MNKTMLVALLFGLYGAAAMAQVALPGGLSPNQGPAQSSLPPGLYVQVIDGLIHVSNPAGAQNFAAGQFGFTSFNQPPVILPKNPGLIFTPPPTFSSNTLGPTATASSGPSNTVDCEVR
jgi:hypothetical protein